MEDLENINFRKINKEDVVKIIKDNLERIKEINNYYKKLFEWDEDKRAIVEAIEEEHNSIQDFYKKLFEEYNDWTYLVNKLDNQIKEIQDYHRELFEWENSIKSDIDDSHENITDFYNYLFWENGKEWEIKNIIENIEKNYAILFEWDDSKKSEIDKMYSEVLEKYKYLFETGDKNGNTKIDKLESQIKDIENFHKKVNNEINLDIKSKQDYLKEIEKDINIKRGEINTLLSDATAKSLADWYRESMLEYSVKKKLIINDWENKIGIFFYNYVWRFLSIFFSYAIFFLPLIFIVILFFKTTLLKNFIDTFSNSWFKLSIFEIFIFKWVISLPLLWISWFWQKTISQRRRLFEEYNHKYRVVQMYLLFVTNENTYKLTNKEHLEKILMETILHNPWIYLWKWDTMLDKIFEKVKTEWLYDKVKDQLKKDLVFELNINNKNN